MKGEGTNSETVEIEGQHDQASAPVFSVKVEIEHQNLYESTLRQTLWHTVLEEMVMGSGNGYSIP